MRVSKKLRILFVTNNYTPYSGGVVSSIDALANQLRASGHKVFIVTLDFLRSRPADPYYVLRVPCQVRFMYKKNYMALPFYPYAFIHEQVTLIKPDIIHVHHPVLLGTVARDVARECGIPICFTYHTLYERYLHYLPLPTCISRPLVIRKVLQFCAQVDGIIAPSRAVQDFLDMSAIVTPKVLIPSPILPVFCMPSVLKKTMQHPYLLLSVGRFAKEKNLIFLLDVMKLLPAGFYCLTLVGYGVEYESLQRYAYKTLGLSQDVVRFIIAPSKDTLRSLYQDAHLFLFSSTTDTQGLVLAESMAAGTPVIAIDGPGQRDIIESGKNGFLVRDREHMAYEIRRVMHDVQLYESLCENAYHTAKRYSPEVLVGRLLQFYSDLASSHRHKGI